MLGLHCCRSCSLFVCMGFSLWCLLMLQSVGSWVCRLQQLQLMGSVLSVPGLSSTDSVVVAPGLSCPRACGIFPDQALNPSLLHWQADSLPLSHWGCPTPVSFICSVIVKNLYMGKSLLFPLTFYFTFLFTIYVVIILFYQECKLLFFWTTKELYFGMTVLKWLLRTLDTLWHCDCSRSL